MITKAILKGSVEPTIQHPSGVLDKQINRSELIKNPAKYVNTYPSFYENLGEIKHEVNTRSVARKRLGKSTKVITANSNKGISYNVFAGTKVKKAKPVKVDSTSARTLVNPADAQIRKQAEIIAKLKADLEAAKKPKPATRKKAAPKKKEEEK